MLIIVKNISQALDLVESKNKSNLNRHPWEYARFEVLLHFLKKKMLTNSRPVIVDIGCGDTFVVESILKHYPQAIIYAVDIAFTPEIINEIKEKGLSPKINLHYHLKEVPLNVQADVILLMDVIEHIEDDVDFLKEVKLSHFSGGKTNWFITVPAFQHLFCSHDVFLGHYRRYDTTMLRTHLNKAELKTIEIGYFFFSLLVPRWLQVRKEKKKPASSLSTGIVDWNKGVFITLAVKWMLILDFKFSKFLRLFGIKLKGLSVYSICQE